MTRDLLVLPDGRELFSGAVGGAAIASFRCTRRVMDGASLDYAAACAAMIEAELLHSAGICLDAGQELRWYTVSDAGERTLRGYFLTDEVVRPSANTLHLTAYDRMLRFDTDLTGWLTALDGWPYTIRDLLAMTCEACGVELGEAVLVNGDYPVMRFVRQVTGRQLLRWIAGANAAFACITPEGKLTLQTLGEGEVSLPVKTLALSDFSTAPIARVTVRQLDEDVGVSWPEEAGETYAITDNPLLAADSAGALLPYVKRLADTLVGVSYTPGKAEFFDEDRVCPVGVFFTVTDAAGKVSRMAAFSAQYGGGITVIQCTGEQHRQSAPSMNKAEPVSVVQGRTARLEVALEGLTAEVARKTMELETVKSQTAALTLESGGILARVEDTEEALLSKADAAQLEPLRSSVTQVQQRAEDLTVSVSTLSRSVDGKAEESDLKALTEHFRFDADGMTITNSGTGMGINVSEEQVAFLGAGEPTTLIRPNDMQTTNLRVGTRLDLGNFSLFPRNNGNLSLRYTGGST